MDDYAIVDKRQAEDICVNALVRLEEKILDIKNKREKRIDQYLKPTKFLFFTFNKDRAQAIRQDYVLNEKIRWEENIKLDDYEKRIIKCKRIIDACSFSCKGYILITHQTCSFLLSCISNEA